jgi:hypothetical protein
LRTAIFFRLLFLKFREIIGFFDGGMVGPFAAKGNLSSLMKRRTEKRKTKNFWRPQQAPVTPQGPDVACTPAHPLLTRLC